MVRVMSLKLPRENRSVDAAFTSSQGWGMYYGGSLKVDRRARSIDMSLVCWRRENRNFMCCCSMFMIFNIIFLIYIFN